MAVTSDSAVIRGTWICLTLFQVIVMPRYFSSTPVRAHPSS